MANIPVTKQLLAYDSRGRGVCFDHGSRCCGICCVDFTGIFRHEDEDENEDDERVFVLVGETARFIPQWDEQVQGPENVLYFDKSQRLIPDTPEKLRFHYCGQCELTWLVGSCGLTAASSHPSHHTLHHSYAGTCRSAVVFIDGACPSNDPSASRAAIGAYYGPSSSNNISRLLNVSHPTNQVAELTAAIEALRAVRKTVVPRRRALLEADALAISQYDINTVRRFRLVVATDSSYLVECMCQDKEKWTIDESTGLYKNQEGQTIKNSSLFSTLSDEVDHLSLVGIQVVWYHVPRRFNSEADALANDALSVAAR